jgi:hypothetical protein
MNKASYRYQVIYKHSGSPKLKEFVTGYVPTGLRMSQIQRYIQGTAQEMKIIGIKKLTQRYYYQEISPESLDGSIDVSDSELFEAQQALKGSDEDDQ